LRGWCVAALSIVATAAIAATAIAAITVTGATTACCCVACCAAARSVAAGGTGGAAGITLTCSLARGIARSIGSVSLCTLRALRVLEGGCQASQLA
jgi:hypothetical protein